MNFFESVHCTSRAHCKTCRDKINGANWRSSIFKAFDDVGTEDFDCPNGTPLAVVAIKRGGSSVFQNLYNEIIEEEKDEWILRMASQCKEMYDNPPEGITCKTRKDFRNRWYQKLKYYRREMRNEKATV